MRRTPMRDDFAVFILTHGRPHRQRTIANLGHSNYTGRLYFVIDDEDDTGDELREIYGADKVLMFSKDQIASTFDTGDLGTDRRTIVYARNAVWDLARQVGVRYFVQLDDDYTSFGYRMIGKKHGSPWPSYHGWTIRNLDAVWEAMIEFVATTPTLTLAMAQGGDVLGGAAGSMGKVRMKRKAMNSFVCDVEKPFTFLGRINEDVNTYVWGGRIGQLFFTYSPLQLTQVPTQQNEGGMSDTYRDTGTYIKSFFTVMYAPSCVEIRQMGDTNQRLHHHVNWNVAVPMIVSEDLRRQP
jgi:hypothetical protein